MVHLKNKCVVQVMILLVLTFSFPGFSLANAEYKIISFKGKVKVKKDGEVFPLEKQLHITLEKSDAVMAYPEAAVDMVFPPGDKKSFDGPFYSTVENLEKPIKKDGFSFFKKSTRWKRIQRMFDEEGNESVTNPRGTHEDSLNFYDEINPVVLEAKIEDKELPPPEKKQMKEILETVKYGFNAFAEEKQTVICSLVYKSFGWYKTALTMIFDHYKGILYTKGKQLQRELMEDYLFNEFLPIVIAILPDHENRRFKVKFSSNFKLWWASFFFDGNKFRAIEKSFKRSGFPQDTFKIKETPAMIYADRAASPCVFIVACAESAEMQNFDNMKNARQELLLNNIKETRSRIIQDYGKVIIKLCF